MMETIQKLELSIENLKNKSARIYFFVMDTKGNAKASVKYTYDLALTLKESGYNSIILHEKSDYFGVDSWLGEEYMSKLPHQYVEGQNLAISPEDTIIVPEIFGYVMSQISNLPCAKIVLCQSYDYIFETLEPGQTWSQLGFTKCITTSEKLKTQISQTMRGVSIDIIEPFITNDFTVSKYPAKPVISVHSREQRDKVNLIKNFYVKYPQYRWIAFRDMRGMSISQFANGIKESMGCVWIDKTSSFGTFPIESMSCGVPVIGLAPSIQPEWMSEDNGIWTLEQHKLVDIIAEYIQNWLEDNISEQLYEKSINTAKKYQSSEKFEKSVLSTFERYQQIRSSNFEMELNKIKQETV